MNYSEEWKEFGKNLERIWKEFGKKAGLMVFIMIVFLAIPVVTTSAQNAMKGDPVIICVSSELIRAKERTARTEDASFGDIIFHLDVQLKAVKHFTSTANATLRFKDIASLAVEQTMTGEKNEPKILQSQTTWNAMRRGKTQSALQPFAITGFQRLPERIAFELDITYRNPNDNELYVTTLSIIPGIPDATIDITYISDPPNRPKGDVVPITIKVKNTGSEYAIGLFVAVRVKSIGAGTTIHQPYINGAYDSIVLRTSRTVLTMWEFMAPQSEITINFNIACVSYSNGALNIGLWEIIQVEAYAYNSPTVYSNAIVDPEFSVTAKSKNNGPHAVFIYYLWNSGGTGNNWGGDNPKNYFVNGFGDVKAGLWRFSTYDSNIPVLINPMIAYDDHTWSIPLGMHSTTQMINNGRVHVASKLGINEWKIAGGQSFRKNCGFDLILMLAGKRGDVAGLASGNCAVACKWRAGLPSGPNWRKNIDGIVQHEVSHLFGCRDVIGGHQKVECIMAYFYVKIWIFDYFHSYIYEHATRTWGHQENHWHSSCTCQSDFNTGWEYYYTINLD